MSLISVVVSVYNVESDLPRCLDSILAQTYRNFKVLLVNDGSTDDSPEICNQYAQRDSRIQVIHQENRGVSAARNLGIEWALQSSESEWITFIDSDDWIHPELLSILLNAAVTQHEKVSACSFVCTTEQMPHDDVADCEAYALSVGDFYMGRTVNFVVPWGKLYRKELFQDVRFPIGLRYEDEYTIYKALFQCDNLAYVDAPLYYYYTNPNGFMNKGWSVKKLQALGALKEHIKFFREKGELQLFRFAVHRYVEEIVGHLRCIDGSANPLVYEKETRRIVAEARKYVIRYWLDGVFDIRKDRKTLERIFPRIMHLVKK